MFEHLFQRYQLVMLLVLFLFLVLVGYGELKILNRITVACTTWSFALVIGTAFIIEIFKDSTYGKSIGLLFLVFGFIILLNVWRRSSARK